MSATKQNIEQLELKPLYFDAFDASDRRHRFQKKQYKLTTTNPFTTMCDADWKEYVATREPHFTSEPYYELIPWQELQQLEVDAKAAGLELILRTTNNTAYCPGHAGQFWCQRTQWIFGLPNMQFLILLTYNEDKYSYFEEKNTKELPGNNYFNLHIVSTTKFIVREKTAEELDEEIDNAIELNLADELDYSYSFAIKQCQNKDLKYEFKSKHSLKPSPILKYYASIKPASGWVQHTGMSLSQGHSQFNYIFAGSNARLEPYGYYAPSEDADTQDDEGNLMTTMITPAFWKEWIENNKDIIAPGVFDKIQITDWSDTYVLPGENFYYVNEVLKWDMDYRFLKQLMQTTISNWTKNIYGYECCDAIQNKFWNIRFMGSSMNNPELFKKTCILEAKKAECAIASANDEWIPFNGYLDSLFLYQDFRLSQNAQTLIKQVWDYINREN